jgi:hypothetical protein
VANGWVSIQGTAGNCAFTWLTSPYGDGKAYLDGTRANMINNDNWIITDAGKGGCIPVPLSNTAIYLLIALISLYMVVKVIKW